MLIRKYILKDFKEVLCLFKKTIKQVNIKDYSLEEINAWTNIDEVEFANKLSSSYTLVALMDQKIVGFANLKENYLDCLYVHYNYQNKGIASQLLNEILNEATFPVFTYASITAKNFFINNGFYLIKENKVIKNGVTLTNYLMEKYNNNTFKGFHNPSDENSYLSNWYLSYFTINNVKYSSMEQYMMHQKALYFNDNEIAKEIMKTDDFATVKALGRKVKNYNDIDWNGVRQIIVYEGLLAKFSQNDDLKDLLLKTGDSILVECSISDKIWANGIDIKEDDRFNQSKWTGKNLLGYSLMLVREKIKKT